MKKILIFTSAIVAGFISFSCDDVWNHCVEGNGNRITDIRNVEDFRRLQVNGDFDVQIDTGDILSVKIEADENLMDLIETHGSGDKLIIESKNGICLNPGHTIEITVNVPKLTDIELNGSGYIYNYGMKTEELSVTLSGSGQIACYDLQTSAASFNLEGSGSINSNLVANDIKGVIEGSGEIRLTGSATTDDLKIIGSGKIKADQLNTNACLVTIIGSGTVDTWVNNALEVTIEGSGIVYYKGNPALETTISGSGKVIQR